MKSFMKYFWYTLGSLPGQIIGAILGIIISFKFLRPGSLLRIKYRPIKTGEWGTAIISLLIRVGFGVGMKVALKMLYDK